MVCVEVHVSETPQEYMTRIESDLVSAVLIIKKLMFAPHEEQYRRVAIEFLEKYKPARVAQ